MHLKRKFDDEEFAVLAEMEPPKGVDVSNMVANATKVKGKVDAFVVPEMSSAVMRMSSLGAAMLLQGKGIETVMQVCCRDRNRLALQADLLAANGCGIANIMAVTGDKIGFGDHHEAKEVYDIGLMELLQAIRQLQQGRDMAGIDLAGSPEFLVGSTINAGAEGGALEQELEELSNKTEAGAQFFITPPLFDIDSIEPFLKLANLKNIKIIPTVLLLKSVGMARYIDRHLEHVYIPGALINRLQKSPEKVRECITIASEIVVQIKEKGLSGVLLSTLGWENRLPDILEKI